MKKLKIAILMILVIYCFGCITGCSPKEEQKSSEKENDNKVYDASLISEKISQDGTYTNDYGSYEYSFHVPQIISESKDAKKINNEIMENIGTAAEESLEAIKAEEFPLSDSITWSDEWNGSMLSLLITEYSSSGPAEYTVYNFDFKEEKAVKNDEIFRRLNLTEEEFMSVAKKEAFKSMNNWKDENPDIEEHNIKMYYEGIYPLNVTTLQNINSETAKLIVGKDKIQMILEGFVPAGGGTYSELISLDFSKKEQTEKTVEYKGITSKLKDGIVSVQYNGEAVDWIDVGSCLVDGDQLKGGKEYPVSGCYRDYTDIFISQAGDAQNAYLYLLTEDGNLEMVNLIKGATAGVLSAIPIPYLTNITTVEQNIDSSKEVWSYAVEKDGTKHDLALFANAVEKSPHQFLPCGYIAQTDKIINKSDDEKTYNSYFELILDENGKIDINEFLDGESKSVVGYSGNISLLGCNNEGTIYYFDIVNEKSKEIYIGSFLIRNVKTMDEYGGIEFDQVEIKVNTGVDIFNTHDKWLKVVSTNAVG